MAYTYYLWAYVLLKHYRYMNILMLQTTEYRPQRQEEAASIPAIMNWKQLKIILTLYILIKSNFHYL